MNKVSSYILYIYMSPVFISLYFISSTGFLLGDFRRFPALIYPDEVVLISMYYLIPLLIIYGALKLVDKISTRDFEDKNTEQLIFYTFIIIGIFTILFGANVVGKDGMPGITGLGAKIIAKLSPLSLIALLAFTNINFKKFAVCLFISIIYGYKQESLQGIFISVLSLGVYLILRYKLRWSVIFLVMTLPLLLIGPILDVVSYLYTLRNEIRGVHFNVSEILSLAIGRISTTSPLIYIINNDFDVSKISNYFSFGMILDRLSGFSFVNSISPSDIFNLSTVGKDADYSIFMGLPGFLFFLAKGSLIVLGLNITILIFLLMLIYYLIPAVNNKHRKSIFFMIMYLPFLSFDIWEISIIFQTIVFWRILIFSGDMISGCLKK